MDANSLVVYKTYHDPMAANIELGVLRSCNIFCCLADENLITVNPFYTQALGGIKLQVRACDVQQVTEILHARHQDAASAMAESEAEATRCPHCGSGNTHEVEPQEKSGTLTKIAHALYPPIPQQDYCCEDCGRAFRLPSSNP
jgi:DNA-directed RNA polymerase subunit RPC12/RpoP